MPSGVRCCGAPIREALETAECTLDVPEIPKYDELGVVQMEPSNSSGAPKLPLKGSASTIRMASAGVPAANKIFMPLINSPGLSGEIKTGT
jgi:hypothetical protein